MNQKSWMTDGSERVVLVSDPNHSGNILNNLQRSGESVSVLSYRVQNGESIKVGAEPVNEYGYYDNIIKIDSDGYYSFDDSYKKYPKQYPLRVDYVLQQGKNTISSFIEFTDGKTFFGREKPVPKWYDAPEHVASNHSESIKGNVLDNVVVSEGKKQDVFVEYFGIQPDSKQIPHAIVNAGEKLVLAGVGSMQLNQDGSYLFVPENGYTGQVPTINYAVKNSRDNSIQTSMLDLSVRAAEPNDAERTVLSDGDERLELDWTNWRVNQYSVKLHTGNLLDADANTLDGKPTGKAEIVDFTLDGKTYAAGETAIHDDFDLTVRSDGLYILYHKNQYDGLWHNIHYTLSNGVHKDKSVFEVYMSGDSDSIYDPPWDRYQDQYIPNQTITVNDTKLTGSVFKEPVYFYDGLILRVESYTVGGMKYRVGETAAIFGVGTFTLNKNGSYTVSIEGQRHTAFKIPEIKYSIDWGGHDIHFGEGVLNVNLNNKIPVNHYAEANVKANGHADLTQTKVLENYIETGNVLDAYGAKDKPYISGFKIGDTYYATNQSVAIDGVGAFTLNRDGSYFINVTQLPNSEHNWQIPDVAFTVTNGYKASSSKLHFQAGIKLMEKEKPVVDDDETVMLTGQQLEGSVIESREDAASEVTAFIFDGKSYQAGQTVDKEGVGSFTLNANGTYQFIADSALKHDFELPIVYKLGRGGIKSDVSALTIKYDQAHNAALAADLKDVGEYLALDPFWEKQETIIVPHKGGYSPFDENGIHEWKGNVLANASSTLNGKPVGELSVVGFTADGLYYDAGSTVYLKQGVFTLNADGSFEYKDIGWIAGDGAITYIVSNGAKTTESAMEYSYYAYWREDWVTAPPDVGESSYYKGEVIAGDNRNGLPAKLAASDSHVADLVVGDVYSKEVATTDELNPDAKPKFINNHDDIFIGDRLNIDNLSWDVGGVTVKGSSYENSVEGLRAYVKAVKIDGGEHKYLSEWGMSDKDIVEYVAVSFVQSNYASLMDTNPQGGDDTIIGGRGADIIIGNAGNDTLTGNYGEDTFVFMFNSNSGQDVITDFTKGADKIVFSDVVDTSKLIWEADIRTLKFTGVQNGQTYENSIYIQNGSVDLKLEDLLGTTG